MGDELNVLLDRRKFLVRAGLASAGILLAPAVLAACSNAASSSPAASAAASTAATLAPSAAASTAASLAPSASAAASIDLSGTGEVVVPDVGGILAAAFQGAYFDPFTKATGIKVTLNAGNFDASVVLAQALAGAPPYDLNNPNGATVQAYVTKGGCEKIDYSLWNPVDKTNIGPAKATDYYVPAYYFALVPAWSTKAFPTASISGWQDIFDTTKYAGKRAFAPGAWGAGGGTFELALLADGIAPGSLYPLDGDHALEVLKKFKPNILKFWESGSEPGQLINAGQAVMVSAWNGRVDGAKIGGTAIADSWSQAILQYDTWSILKGAKNLENAQKLLAFIQQPTQQYAFAELITYSPSNQDALNQLSPARQALLPTSQANMTSAIVQDYTWWESASPTDSSKTNEEVLINKWQEWIATY